MNCEMTGILILHLATHHQARSLRTVTRRVVRPLRPDLSGGWCVQRWQLLLNLLFVYKSRSGNTATCVWPAKQALQAVQPATTGFSPVTIHDSCVRSALQFNIDSGDTQTHHTAPKLLWCGIRNKELIGKQLESPSSAEDRCSETSATHLSWLITHTEVDCRHVKSQCVIGRMTTRRPCIKSGRHYDRAGQCPFIEID